MLPVVTVIVPTPAPIASDAFVIRFITTCRICVRSADMAGIDSARWRSSCAPLLIAVASRFDISRTTSDRSVGSTTKRPLPE
jgi:hypothetical protein